jgi:hypothetical protein
MAALRPGPEHEQVEYSVESDYTASNRSTGYSSITSFHISPESIFIIALYQILVAFADLFTIF